MKSHVDTRAGKRGAAAGEPPARARSGARGAAEGTAAGAVNASAESGRAPITDLGPLSSMIGYALRRAQLAVFEEAIRAFAKLDLRPAQYSVLALIGYKPGLKQSDVARALGIQRANFVTLLDGLERRGLARRRAIPNDRRSHALHLTEEGERLLRRAGTVVAGIEARLDAKLGPGGRPQLLDLLARLTAE
jgi:DNA-binding MarR family transcriptional regulator